MNIVSWQEHRYRVVLACGQVEHRPAHRCIILRRLAPFTTSPRTLLFDLLEYLLG